ncbi:MAG: hypothetical protein AAGJ46_11970 [Planctomycetota bacterium]
MRPTARRPKTQHAPLLSLATLALAATLPSAARGADAYDLTAAEPVGFAAEIDIALEFGGELVAPDFMPKAMTEQLKKKRSKDKPAEQEFTRSPLSVTSQLRYVERALTGELALRQYEVAEATIKSAAGVRLPKLPSSRRLIVARQDGAGPRTLASPGGALTREQLDLLGALGDPAALDSVLPGRRIEEGEKWEVDQAAIAILLGLDSIAVCGVEGSVDQANRRYVRFELAGDIEGAADAAATEIDFRAVGLFDRQKQIVTQLNVAMTEKREVGPARPGVEGTAKAKIKRRLTKPTGELATATAAGLTTGATPPTDLVLRAGPQGFEVEHDRKWRLAAEAPDALTLRRIEPVGLVAQTTLKRLPAKASGMEMTADELVEEIRSSLGDSLTEIVSTETWNNQEGCRCLGLVAHGELDGAPLEWRYYVVMPGNEASGVSAASADARHAVSIMTTIEAPLVKRVGDADRDLADRLKMIPPTRARVAMTPPERIRRSPKRSSSKSSGTATSSRRSRSLRRR